VSARSSAGHGRNYPATREGDGTDALPEVEIDDYLSLAYGGVMFDLSHGASPPRPRSRQIDFGALKGNQYYLLRAIHRAEGLPPINPGGRYTQDEVLDHRLRAGAPWMWCLAWSFTDTCTTSSASNDS
jgi:hypothetical protein